MTEKIQMNFEEHYRKLERLYLGAPCNDYYRPQLKIGKGTAELIIPVREEFFHAAGAVHGSVYFKSMDDAAFFAANSLVADVFVLTASFHVQFLRPITSGEMRTVGKVIYSSSRYFFAESAIYNSRGVEIARGSGNFVRSGIQLTPEIGYK